MQITADVLTAIVAAVHLYILVLEMFLWNTPRGRAAFGTTEQFAAESKVLAANQGLYNGFLAAGLVVAVVASGPVGFAFAVFFLACVIVAGLYGAATVSRRILFVQAVPAAIAEQLGLPGRLLVETVASGGPADSAGLRPNDVVTRVNGQPATSVEQITVAELGARSGRPVELTYLRGGTAMTVTLVPVRVQR